jgi:hypothetical protein
MTREAHHASESRVTEKKSSGHCAAPAPRVLHVITILEFLSFALLLGPGSGRLGSFIATQTHAAYLGEEETHVLNSSSLPVRLRENMKSRSFLYHNMEDEELLHKAASMQQLQDHISCNPQMQQSSTVQKFSSRRRIKAGKLAFLLLMQGAYASAISLGLVFPGT